MTRDQKERYVIELHTQDKTVREIIQLVHMSPRDVVTIINKYKREVERENGQVEDKDDYDIKSKSKESQAFKLFSEGQTPTQVLIELDLPPEKVRGIYRQYLEMTNQYNFLQAYDQVIHSGRYTISSLLRLHRIVSDLGMGEQQIVNVLNLADHNQLEHLQGKVEYLANEVTTLEEKKTTCINDLGILEKRRDDYMSSEYAYESHLAELREEIGYIESRSRSLRLDNRMRELPYNGGGMYPLSRVHSTSR
jgi:hypothetical protein